MKSSISKCERQPAELARLYESVTFEQVHGELLNLLPRSPSRILDVGAGSGRDAAALAARGHLVTAVEPSSGLRSEAMRLHANASVEWVDDRLPTLSSLRHRRACFDLILLSAVWMYVDVRDRNRAMRRLDELLAPGGLLVLTLRRGTTDAVSGSATAVSKDLAADPLVSDLEVVRTIVTSDVLGRPGVSWSTIVFRKLCREQITKNCTPTVVG